MDRLRKRPEFLAVAGGPRVSRRGFVLQKREHGAPDRPPRFGFTVTKKIGNAVVRNRIRRRLREAVRIAAPLHARPATDYVLVGRRAALDQAFAALVADLSTGLDALARPRPETDARPGPPRPRSARAHRPSREGSSDDRKP
ncbi:ribonuclease P protein component [Prosthecomicrobium pneumaticum]|uniref:Ribonuclease P protein component n=1 Tax=Prosthecomicrobium pneumaticum TaxID=81895 RepID=A0A7W9FNE0_9HYPH|nr:ribonuclease P protein component [Prosthecomicrobium pneumaticum]MBB5753854.1 ribonuclease P protein component [Prosthecomicrobium pneumaticum]